MLASVLLGRFLGTGAPQAVQLAYRAFFFFQAEDGIRDYKVTGVQTCALPIYGAYVRKNFFGRDPRALKMVEHMSDDEIWNLRRGGHDSQKVYAAFHAANSHKGQPTVLLVKTVKGFGMGKIGEGKNTVHQTKKLGDEDIKAFRDRFNIPIPDSQIADLPFYKPADDTPEMRYLHERRKALGGYLPHRRVKASEQFTAPALDTFKAILEPTPEI